MVVGSTNNRVKWYFVLILVVVITTSIDLITRSYMVSAENDDMSWTDGPPSKIKTTTVDRSTFYVYQPCPLNITVYGEYYPATACVDSNESIKFAIYTVDQKYYRAAVSFRNDSTMYPVDLDCNDDLCTYMPDTDTLVIKQRKGNNLYGLVVYKNFTSRLTRHIDTVSMTTDRYTFNFNNPSYELKDSNNFYWSVGTVTPSDNGKYLAVELYNKGVAVLDVNNLTMKYVTGRAFEYWRGFDPSIEFAITNDGKHLAETGMNAGFAVFDIDDSCGELLDARRMDSSLAPVVNPCNSTNFNYAFVNNFYRGYRPSFSFGGDQLTFYATSWNDPNYYRVEINAKAYAGTKLSYLALGDSFSSGEGAWLDSEYLDGTNTGFDKCHISINSYPFIFARMSGLDMNYTKSVACSGAVMGDVIGEDDQYLGQGSRVKYYKPTLTDTDISNMQLSTLLSLTPGRIHQASFVQHNNPYIITIGIGGNDVGFADKLKACLGPDTCSWAGTAIGKEQTAIELRGIYSKLVDTYTSLHNDSPNSKIYVIGYPKLFDESGACGPLIGYLLNADERKFINEAVIYLNQVIKSASETTGVKYIDIADSFGDGAICGDAYPGSMNAVRLGDDFALINKFEWLRVIGQESFHPNILGHAQIATTIKNTVSNIGTYEYCNNGKVICPVVTLPPSPGEYWVPGIYHDYPKQVSTKFSADGSDDSTKTIKIPEYSLSPTSTIEITIASTPQSLGTFMTGDKGDFDKAITLPNGLEPGYHTIHINGLSYSGEKIDLYDVFAYKVPSNIETPISKSESDTPDNKVTLSSYSDNTELVAVIYPDHSQAIDNSNEPPKYSTSSGQVKGASTNIASVKPSNAISNNLIFVVVVVSGVSLVIMKLLAVRQLKRR